MADLFENLEPDDKKLVEWLQHMYGCWEKRLTGEEWAAEFQTMKDALESMKGAYPYVTGQLLALVAKNDDLDTFTKLLDCGEYDGAVCSLLPGIRACSRCGMIR